MDKKKNRNNKAQAMIVVFVYVGVLALIAVYVTTYANNLHRMAVKNINHTKAFYAAEAGIIRQMAVAQLAADPTNPTTVVIAAFDFPDLGEIPPGTDPTHDRLQCTVTVSVSNAGMAHTDEYWIRSTVSDWWTY